MNSLGRDTALSPSWFGLEGTPLSSREHLSSREQGRHDGNRGYIRNRVHG